MCCGLGFNKVFCALSVMMMCIRLWTNGTLTDFSLTDGDGDDGGKSVNILNDSVSPCVYVCVCVCV